MAKIWGNFITTFRQHCHHISCVQTWELSELSPKSPFQFHPRIETPLHRKWKISRRNKKVLVCSLRGSFGLRVWFKQVFNLTMRRFRKKLVWLNFKVCLVLFRSYGSNLPTSLTYIILFWNILEKMSKNLLLPFFQVSGTNSGTRVRTSSRSISKFVFFQSTIHIV